MIKSKMVMVRITEQQHERIKNAGKTFADIFAIGYNEFIKIEKDYLFEEAQKHKELYNQCISKLGRIEDIDNTMYKQIDDLKIDYLKQDRSIDNPSAQDINWIKARIKKKHIDGLTIEKFIEVLQK